MPRKTKMHSKIVPAPVQEIPVLNAALLFSRPQMICAGVCCHGDRIAVYSTLDGELNVREAGCNEYKTPRDALIQLLIDSGIGCGRVKDGLLLEGRIIGSSTKSQGYDLLSECPNVWVRNNKVLWSFVSIFDVLSEAYPDNVWSVI